jgi:SAM-dependent methyltransferase
VRAEATVPCNNDLLAENFIDCGGELRLIDYEYSGNNEPSFELGNVWSEANLSPAQLDRDRESARLYKLDIECIEGDMLDLSELRSRDFDLVYQPVSTCYVADLQSLYGEVAAVVRTGGWYWSEHWNPVHMQLEDLGRWSGRGYRIVRPQQQNGPVIFTDENGEEGPGTCWHFIHTLEELIGTLGSAHFAVEGFAERLRGDARAEPGSDDHVCVFAPPLLTVLARRLHDDGG